MNNSNAELLWSLAISPTHKTMTDERLADELLAAETRFIERTGRQPRTLYVAPGELIEAEGYTVLESKSIQPKHWQLSAQKARQAAPAPAEEGER